jgi:hypothetical protein
MIRFAWSLDISFGIHDYHSLDNSITISCTKIDFNTVDSVVGNYSLAAIGTTKSKIQVVKHTAVVTTGTPLVKS